MTLAAQRREVIDYLNKKTDSHFKPNADGNKRVIDPRLKEDYTVADMKMIIDAMYVLWHGKTFNNGQPGDNYLKPETLFRVSKIEGYLNIARKMKTQKKTNDPFDMGDWIRE
ncbi:MAG: conserved phage C-terminal domain-containing protein [Limosilactobacillus sp.]|nr:conserved phage C-terminal domain-containing protein [Limosilactobacillus sp.]